MRKVSEKQIKELRNRCEELYEKKYDKPFYEEAKARVEGMAWAFAWILEEKNLPDTLREELDLETDKIKGNLEKLKDMRETVHSLYEDSENSYDQHVLGQLSKKLEDAIQALE